MNKTNLCLLGIIIPILISCESPSNNEENENNEITLENVKWGISETHQVVFEKEKNTTTGTMKIAEDTDEILVHNPVSEYWQFKDDKCYVYKLLNNKWVLDKEQDCIITVDKFIGKEFSKDESSSGEFEKLVTSYILGKTKLIIIIKYDYENIFGNMIYYGDRLYEHTLNVIN